MTSIPMQQFDIFSALVLPGSIVIGLVTGSFLNVVVDRAHRKESLGGRSRCDSCSATLGAWELIPVLSFFFQKKRCRSCSASLSWQYPAVELGAGALFGLSSFYLRETVPLGSLFFFSLVGSFFMLAAALVILVADIKYYVIPNGAVLVLFSGGLAMSAIRFSGNPLASSVWDVGIALFLFLFFAALWFLSKGRWLGFGDAKLVGALALLLGFPLSVALFFFSFWLGTLGALFLLVLRKKGLKDRMPFGPFILLGASCAYFWGEAFLVYTGFFALL